MVDLEAACELYGRGLPRPLGRSRPVGSVWLATRAVAPIEDRLHDGDLRSVRAWVAAVMRADVAIECSVHFFRDGGADLRVHGMRAGESSFVAVQTREADGIDVVDIHGMPPVALAAAVVDVIGLVGAGARPRIAVPGDGDQLPGATELRDEYDDLGFLIPRAEIRDPVPVVDVADIVATGKVRVQGRSLQWVQIVDDGDYLYESGGTGYAEPMDAATLVSCLDGLIAEAAQRYSATNS